MLLNPTCDQSRVRPFLGPPPARKLRQTEQMKEQCSRYQQFVSGTRSIGVSLPPYNHPPQTKDQDSKRTRMSIKSLQDLGAVLPGGTFLTFTAIAQLTTNTTDMASRLATEACRCSSSGRAVDSKSCNAHWVCGAGYWEMTLALVVISAVVVCTLAWSGEDLTVKRDMLKSAQTASSNNKKPPEPSSAAAAPGPTPPASRQHQRHPDDIELTPDDNGSTSSISDITPHRDTTAATAAAATPPAAAAAALRQGRYRKATSSPAAFTRNMQGSTGVGTAAAPLLISSSMGKGLTKAIKRHQEFKRKVEAMSPAQRRRKYAELFVAQVVRTVGAVVIFLTLAVLTPPVSTCLLEPCRVPPVVSHALPHLLLFAFSAFMAVQKKVICRFVYGVDWLLHPKDHEPGSCTCCTGCVDKVDQPQQGELPA